jgi:hypothetical protein
MASKLKSFFNYRFAVVVAIFVAAVLLQIGIAQEEQADKTVSVGTYNPQQIFSMYEGTQELQAAIIHAQEQGDMDKQQLQQLYQQKQQELVQQFQKDLSIAIPQAAEDANVQLIAVQVSYSAPEVEIKDLTADLAARINQSSD